jgi:hypothetical protein
MLQARVLLRQQLLLERIPSEWNLLDEKALVWKLFQLLIAATR